jgi:cell cycle arrest protein BUB3
MSFQSKFMELKTPTDLDIVSDVQFTSLAQNNLLVSSWDNRILLYDCGNVDRDPASSASVPLITHFETETAPLCMVNVGTNSTYVGLLDGSIRQIDYENMMVNKHENLNICEQEQEIGHGVNHLCQVKNLQDTIVASTFDGLFRVIDTRQKKPVLINQENHGHFAKKRKIFTMDTSQDYLMLGLNSNLIEIYDYRNMNVPFERRELGLNYQIKDLKALPSNDGFALSTIDGRVSLEYFDSSPEVQASKRFTFKCHRELDKVNNTDLVYPVNSIAIHKTYGTLFTSGSDGALCLWDCEKRKRIRMYPKFLSQELPQRPESIVKIALNQDDRMLAIATSDDNYKKVRRLSDNSNRRSPSRIYLRVLEEGECMPKNKI